MRPTTRRCPCGEDYDIAPTGRVPAKCPTCRLPAYRREAAKRTKGEPAVSSAARVSRPLPAPSEASAEPPARGNVLTSHDFVYESDEAEFLAAVDRFKREKRKLFPTLSEILAVLKGLGYAKVSQETR